MWGRIILRSAGLIDVDIDDAGAFEVAARARGTPRIANNLLRWVRDYAQVRADNKVSRDVADAALTMLDIDADGLDEMDKRILEAMVQSPYMTAESTPPLTEIVQAFKPA